VLVVTHRKKLLAQNRAQLARYLGMDEDLGVYSAGLDQRDTSQRVLFGGVASIYRRMDELQQAGDFAYIIVDEAHLCSNPSVDSMYRAVFLGCPPSSQRIGLSATPSRMGVPIWGHDDRWFTRCPVTITMASLTPEYLAPLTSLLSANEVDLSNVRLSKGEFVQSDASQVLSEESVARAAIAEIQELAKDRQAWAIFCCDIAHTNLIGHLLSEAGVPTGIMHSGQPEALNTQALAAFEAGESRALVSCLQMTTGFDVPRIDCVVLLRPTMSKELLIQMLGRGARQAPGKNNTLVLDYAGNLDRHSPLEEIASTRKAPARQERDDAEEARTAEEREREAERQAKHAHSIFAGEAFAVQKVRYEAYAKRNDPSKHLLRVSYYTPARPGSQWTTAYLCFQGYVGFPREQAQAWFARRGATCPATAEAAQSLAYTLPIPTEIVVRRQGEFDRVVLEYFSKADVAE
jgi:DNA repair protein RadD